MASPAASLKALKAHKAIIVELKKFAESIGGRFFVERAPTPNTSGVYQINVPKNKDTVRVGKQFAAHFKPFGLTTRNPFSEQGGELSKLTPSSYTSLNLSVLCSSIQNCTYNVIATAQAQDSAES